MSEANNELSDLQELIDRLLDDRMTDDDVATLNERIKDDPAAQKLLLDYCQFHSILTFDLHAEGVIDRLVQQRERTSASPKERWGAALVSRRIAYAALLTLAASLLLAAGIPWLMRPNAMRFQVDANAALREGTVIRIESGTTELKMAKVGSVFLQGPAELEMLGPTRAKLKRGRIKVRVSDPRGYGFVVEMPNGEVTDLGTEFGLDVSDGGQNGLVVFEGSGSLRVPASPASTSRDYTERLVKGDGVIVGAHGQVDRLMTVFTGPYATFGQLSDSVPRGELPVIVDVKDNLRTGETRKFYEIVPHGLREDALAYADRPEHEWNGIDQNGMPSYLVGADYIKPFNNDKMRKDFKLSVTLSQPARLFVFFDNRIPAPKWLTDSFKDTGDDIAIDLGPMLDKQGKPFINKPRGIGPGVDTDSHYSIWERVVPKADIVVLGANFGETYLSGMYGIAAVALHPEPKPGSAQLGPADYGLVSSRRPTALELTELLFIQSLESSGSKGLSSPSFAKGSL